MTTVRTMQWNHCYCLKNALFHLTGTMHDTIIASQRGINVECICIIIIVIMVMIEIDKETVHIKLHLCGCIKVRTSHCLCEQVWTALSLFVCPSHIGCSRCPVWISFNVNLLSLSIRFQLNVRATRSALPCLFLCALPEWTSTGYSNKGSLIWILRQRRLRYLCSRCI